MAETIFSLEQISSWQSELKAFAQTPRTQFSKKQAVEAMIDEIEAALEDHPYEEVAQKLKALGLDISKGLLKQYVNVYRREHDTEPKETTHKRTSRFSGKSKKSTQRQPQPDKEAPAKKDSLSSQSDNKQTIENDEPQAKPSKSRFIEMPESL